MIIWLASYPKSGNTLIRAILTSLIFSEDGIVDFKNLHRISNFSNGFFLKNLPPTIKISWRHQNIGLKHKKN